MLLLLGRYIDYRYIQGVSKKVLLRIFRKGWVVLLCTYELFLGHPVFIYRWIDIGLIHNNKLD